MSSEESSQLGDNSNLALNMMAGATAGLITDFIAFPLDTIKTRLQASFSGKDFSKVGQTRGYFTGLSASMTISAPACSFYWGGYEFSKRFLTEHFSDVNLFLESSFIVFLESKHAYLVLFEWNMCRNLQ